MLASFGGLSQKLKSRGVLLAAFSAVAKEK